MSKIKKDLISVIIPFYNDYNYFERCISSVLSQKYKNIEIIIINDGSEPHYKKKLNIFEKIKNNKIKVINLKFNQGVSHARNTGIKNAKGKFIAFLDSDDEWKPDKLNYQLNIMKRNKLKFIHGSYNIIDENNNILGKMKAKKLDYTSLINSCDIGLSTVMVKADICKKIKFQNITTKEDYVYWLTLAKLIPTLNGYSKTVTLYRKRQNSLSSSLITKFINAYKVYNKYENFNLFYSFYLVIRLSISHIFKQISLKKNL